MRKIRKNRERERERERERKRRGVSTWRRIVTTPATTDAEL